MNKIEIIQVPSHYEAVLWWLPVPENNMTWSIAEWKGVDEQTD